MVTVHLGDPVHQSVVVRANLHWEDFVSCCQLGTQENRNVWGFHRSFFLKRAYSSQEIAGDYIQIVIHDENGAELLEGPNFLVNFIVLNVEQLAVDRVVDEQIHVFSLGSHLSLSGQKYLHVIDLDVDVLEILLLESFVFEKWILHIFHVLLDHVLQAVEVLLVQPAVHDSVVQSLHESLQPLDHLAGHIVGIHVALYLGKHDGVLLPVVLESRILIYYQVYDVKVGQHASQVVKNFVVVGLLEAVHKHDVLRVEQTIHLKADVLGDCYQLPQSLQELIEHWQSAGQLDLPVSCSLIVRSILFEQRAALAEENQGVEILLFDFVFQVYGFDLEEAEGA